MSSIPCSQWPCLIGQWQRNPAADDHTLMGSLWRRLPHELLGPDDLSWMVRLDSPGPSAPAIRLLGLLVPRIESMAEDLLGWELAPEHLALWSAKDDRPREAWRGKIRWNWMTQCPPGLGDFTADSPPLAQFRDDGPTLSAGPRQFQITGLAPIAQRSSDDEVRLAGYDPRWPALFDRFAAEHYGSTSIPAMPAKPIIDVLVEIPSFELARPVAIGRLAGEAWEYWWYADKMTFIRRDRPLGRRVLHVHLAPANHPVWRGLIFRDRLRSDGHAARQYADLKARLAVSHAGDREKYTQAKADFVARFSQ